MTSRDLKSMSLSPDQIVRIKDRLPGWEKEDWPRLCVLLLGEDGESGALVRAVKSKSFGVKWPSEVERDDFVAERMLDYHNRAVQGTLLVSYDPERGDVVSFLTARHLLYVEAIKFLDKLTRQLSLNDPKFAANNEPEAGSSQDAAFGELITEVQEELQRIRLEGGKRMTRVVEQAALQLYPRLDWSQPAMNLLREHLVRVVRPPSDGVDALTALAQAHRDADQSFQERLERLSARRERLAARLERLRTKIYKIRDQYDIEIEMEKFTTGRKCYQHLDYQYSKLFEQRVILPLDADALVRLLGIKLADAAQRRHRYREALPGLLQGLGNYYETLREYRSTESGGKPL